MARIFVSPNAHARVALKVSDIGFTRSKSDLTEGTQSYDITPNREGSYIVFGWDQYAQVQRALLIMQDEAPRRVANATNRAAAKVRQNIISGLEEQLTLDPFTIARAVEVTAEATPASPAAQVSITYQPVGLNEYEHGQDDTGVYVRVRKSDTEERIEAAFAGDIRGNEGIFQRVYRGHERVGRLPIHERMGPSVMDAAQESPGFLEKQTRLAEWDLVSAVQKERNEVVDELLGRISIGGVSESVTPGAGSTSSVSRFGAVAAFDIFERAIRAIF